MVLAGVLASPAAAAWLFDRSPVGELSAAAVAFLASAPTYQDVMVPLVADQLSLGAISQGAPPLLAGGAPPETAGNQLLYMPCAIANGFVFGTFFGDNKPPVPGPCPEPTSSRWVFDVKTGAMVIFTWFPDDKVAVTSTQCTRYGEWSYDLNFFYDVTEGTLPVHRAMSAQYRTTRHCLYCVARHTQCNCSTPMRERSLLDMEDAQATDFTASESPPASELAAMKHWADWHLLRRTGTFLTTATLTYFSSTDEGAPTLTTLASTWSVGNLSTHRAAGLRAGLAAHLNPPAVRAAWPTTRRAVAAPPPPAAATTANDDDGAEPPTAVVAPPPPRTPVRPTRPGAAARPAPVARGAPSAPAAGTPSVAARPVTRRRRRRSGAHHSLYYDVAVQTAAPALADGYASRGAAAAAPAATRAWYAAPSDASSDVASAVVDGASPAPCAAPAARRDGGASRSGGGAPTESGGSGRHAPRAAARCAGRPAASTVDTGAPEPHRPLAAAAAAAGGRRLDPPSDSSGGVSGWQMSVAGSDSSGGVAAALGHYPPAARGARRALQNSGSGSSDGGTGSSDDLEDVPVGSLTPPPVAASVTVGASRSSPVTASVCGPRAGVPSVSLLTGSPSVDVDSGGRQGACAASEDEGLLSSLGDAPFGGPGLGALDACVWDDTLVPSLWKGGEPSGGGGG